MSPRSREAHGTERARGVGGFAVGWGADALPFSTPLELDEKKRGKEYERRELLLVNQQTITELAQDNRCLLRCE